MFQNIYKSVIYRNKASCAEIAVLVPARLQVKFTLQQALAHSSPLHVRSNSDQSKTRSSYGDLQRASRIHSRKMTSGFLPLVRGFVIFFTIFSKTSYFSIFPNLVCFIFKVDSRTQQGLNCRCHEIFASIFRECNLPEPHIHVLLYNVYYFRIRIYSYKISTILSPQSQAQCGH